MPRNAWSSIYGPRSTLRPLRIAFEIARRLSETQVIDQAVIRARASTAEPSSIHWHPYEIAQGDAGIALMYGYIDACFPDRGWDQVAHFWVERAVRSAEAQATLPAGLFEGLAGLAFTVSYLSRGGRRYRNLSREISSHLTQKAVAQCEALDRTLRIGSTPFGAWDAISGLAGIGGYLLGENDHLVLRSILDLIVSLSQDSNGLPRWYTSAEDSGTWMRNTWPEGHLNCGLAHGIPGPLALLSLASLQGIIVSGQDEAIDRIATWLAAHSVNDPWGVNWPSAIPLVRRGDDLVAGEQENRIVAHAGWCYGSPGVARALWLAGQARKNPAFSELALSAMRAIIRRPSEVRALTSPALCHGIAGLLCITLRFRHDTRDNALTTFGRKLCRNIIEMYEPETLLGYRTTEPGGRRIDQAGLLDGAPGVAMALLAASTTQPPNWDRIFLLS